MERLKKKVFLFLANKLVEKIPDSRNGKEHYRSFLRKRSRKSVFTQHPKTRHKLSRL